MKKIIPIVLLALAPALLASKCNEQKKAEKDVDVVQKEEATAPAEEPNTQATPEIKIMNQMVLVKTKFGDIKLRLYDETPKHRDNFIKLVNEGFYDSLLFHRVMENFMIQGGDPKSKGAAKDVQLGNGGPGYTIPAEFVPGLYHKKGALAAARMPDNMNPKKESSGSQFYIVQGQKFTEQQLQSFQNNYGMKFTPEQMETYKTIGGYPPLDNNYTVFGEVVEGLDVVDEIALVPTNPANRPLEDVLMSITLVSE